MRGIAFRFDGLASYKVFHWMRQHDWPKDEVRAFALGIGWISQGMPESTIGTGHSDGANPDWSDEVVLEPRQEALLAEFRDILRKLKDSSS